MANVNHMKGKAVPIKLSDGKERTLKYTLNALAELEERYGTVEEAFKKLESNSIKAVRCILWAGLMHDKDPNTGRSLTEDEVGELLDVAYMQELMETMSVAMNSDLPNDESDHRKPALALLDGQKPADPKAALDAAVEKAAAEGTDPN